MFKFTTPKRARAVTTKNDVTTKNALTTKILDKISSISFFLSMLASKLQFIPTNVVAPIFTLLSVSLNFLGYGLWFVSSHFYPEHKPKYSEWYGFAAFKEQNKYAAFVGMGGVLLSLAAIALPVLAIPAAWMFFISNAFWAMGEYHKYKSPLQNEQYSKSYLKSCFSFAAAMTLMGLIAALTTTLIFVAPALVVPIFVVSAILSAGIGLVALRSWLDFTFGDHKKLPPKEMSYNKMANELGSSLQLEENPTHQPYHGPGLFASNQDSEKEIELEESLELSPCNTPY